MKCEQVHGRWKVALRDKEDSGDCGLEREAFRAGMSALFSELSERGKILQIKCRKASVP